MLGGRVDVDHELDVVHVHAAGGDVRGHEHAHVTVGERPEVAVAGALREVALQVHGGDAGLAELLGHLLGAVLGAREHHAPARAGGERLDEGLLVVRMGHQHLVVHGGHRGLGVVRRVQHRVLEELLDQHVHAVVQRGGEQQPLRALRGLGEDAGDHGQEAHVGHVVGLVQHGDADVFEREQALLDEVLETPGAGHHDVHAVGERLLLVLLGDATEDHGGVQARGLGERGHGAVDLGGELPRGGQHQTGGAVRTAGHPAGAGGETREAGDQRQRERHRLAGARAAAAEHVPPGQGIGEGLLLDGESFRDAHAGEIRGKRLGHTEVFERMRQGTSFRVGPRKTISRARATRGAVCAPRTGAPSTPRCARGNCSSLHPTRCPHVRAASHPPRQRGSHRGVPTVHQEV